MTPPAAPGPAPADACGLLPAAERPAPAVPPLAPAPEPLAVYVHVPFCARRCAYCDFPCGVYRPDRAGRYLAALAEEARLAAPLSEVAGRPRGSLYLGGGTPTALAETELEALFAALAPLLPGAPPGGVSAAGGGEGGRSGWPAEVSVEANPESLTPGKARLLRRLGVTRVTIGLQAWDDRLLRLLGRNHTGEGFLTAYGAARAAGFLSVGVDLIHGLPGQTLAGWRETLARVLDLGPDHVSAYALQIEEGTALARWAREGRLAAWGVPLPDDDEAAAMYELALAMLAAAGYEHYEVSNFARPGHRSRHNLTYWRNGDWLGLGPGAASHLGRARWVNEGRLGPYAAAVAAGRLPRREYEPPDRERELAESAILGLRLREGVSLAELAARHGFTVADVEARWGGAIARLRAAGLLELQSAAGSPGRRGGAGATGWPDEPGGGPAGPGGERLRLTERAFVVANRVWAELV